MSCSSSFIAFDHMAKDWFLLLRKILPLFIINYQQEQNCESVDKQRPHLRPQATISASSSSPSMIVFTIHQEAQVRSIESLSKVGLFISRWFDENKQLAVNNRNDENHMGQHFKRVICCLEYNYSQDSQKTKKKSNRLEIILFNDTDGNKQIADDHQRCASSSTSSPLRLSAISFEYTLRHEEIEQKERNFLAKSSAALLHLLMISNTSSSDSGVDLHIILPASTTNNNNSLTNNSSTPTVFHLPFDDNVNVSSSSSSSRIENLLKDLILGELTASTSSKSHSDNDVVADAFKDLEGVDENSSVETSLDIKVIRSTINKSHNEKTGMKKQKQTLTMIFSTHQRIAENFIPTYFLRRHRTSRDQHQYTKVISLSELKSNETAHNSKENDDRLLMNLIHEKINNILYDQNHQFSQYLQNHGLIYSFPNSSNDNNNNNNHHHVSGEKSPPPSRKFCYLVGCFIDLGIDSDNHQKKSTAVNSDLFEKSSAYQEYQNSLTAHFFALLRQTLLSNDKLIRYIDVVEARARLRERMTERCRREVLDFGGDENNKASSTTSSKNNITSVPNPHQRHTASVIKQEQTLFEKLTQTVPIFASSSSSSSKKKQSTQNKRRAIASQYISKPVSIATSSRLPYRQFVPDQKNVSNGEQHDDIFLDENYSDNNNYFSSATDDDDFNDGGDHQFEKTNGSLSRFMLRFHPQFYEAKRDELQVISSSLLVQDNDDDEIEEKQESNSSTASPFFIFQFDRKFLVCGGVGAVHQSSTLIKNCLLSSTSSSTSSSNQINNKVFIMDQHAVSERGRLEAFRVQGLQNTVKKVVSLEEKDCIVIPVNDDHINEDATAVLLDFKTRNRHRFRNSSNNNNQNIITNRQVAQLVRTFASVLESWGWTTTTTPNSVEQQHQHQSFIKVTSVPCFVLETFELVATKAEPMIEFLLHLNLLTSSCCSSLNNQNNSINYNSSIDHLHQLSEAIIPPILERFAISRSCRGAIMFHDELTKKDMKLILKSVVNTLQFDQCSHGRVSMKMMEMKSCADVLSTMNSCRNRNSKDDDDDDDENVCAGMMSKKSFIEKSPYAALV